MTHEFDGKAYRRASAHQLDWGARMLDELALQGAERVLDLGCGDGRLTAAIAARVPRGRVLGIDASRGMLETAAALASGNLSFAHVDINAMEFDGEFDVVFSNATLHWVKDHGRLLAAVHRALAPGGAARFNFGGAGNCRNFQAVIREVTARPEHARNFRTFEWPWYMPSVAEYGSLVADSAFGSARVWEENRDLVFPDEPALVGWIDQPSIVPFLRQVPEGDKARFRADVVAAMLRASRVDGGFFETFRRINLLARKAI